MENLDVRIARKVQKWGGGATPFWRFFARYGMYGFVAAFFVFANLMPINEALWYLFGPAVSAFLVTSLLQYIIRRPRPTATKTDFHQWLLHYSFPSAHSSMAFAFAVALTHVSRAVVPEIAPLFMVSAFILALGIALSRVVVGVHYPSDVVAGSLLGSTISLVFATL